MSGARPGRRQGSRGPLALALALAATGCARHLVERPPAPGCTLTADGDRILCDGRPYAALERRFCREEAPGESSCFGLAVRYEDGTLAWIHRGANLERALETGRYAATRDAEAKLGGAYDIQVLDGGRIRFRLPHDVAPYEYDAARGVLRPAR